VLAARGIRLPKSPGFPFRQWFTAFALEPASVAAVLAPALRII